MPRHFRTVLERQGVSDSGLQVSELEESGLGVRVSGSGSRGQDSEFRV